MDRRDFVIRGGRLSAGLAAWRLGVPLSGTGHAAPEARDETGDETRDESRDHSSLEAPEPSRPVEPLKDHGPGGSAGRPGPVTLFLSGDVMTGRGIDQVLPRSVDPVLYEPYVRSARRYVELAEQANGPIPAPVDFSYVWGAALEELRNVGPDLRIINLETAVTTSADPWEGKGVHYRTHPANVPCLTAAGIDCCVLANNHVLDWGYPGLAETLETLRGAGIRTAGAGGDLEKARAPAALEASGGGEGEGSPSPARLRAGDGRVLVFAMGSTTSGIPRSWAASAERPGVHLLPDLSATTVRRIAGEIRRARREGDLAVASIHWGGNWGYGIPLEQREFAHLLIEEGGVDIVHGHSSHHPKGIEVYRDRPILYGCGDFLNDYEGISGYEEYRGDLVLMYFATLDPSEGRLLRFEMTPLRVRRFRLERASPREARWLRDTLDREGRPLGSRVETGEDGRLVLRWGSGA